MTRVPEQNIELRTQQDAPPSAPIVAPPEAIAGRHYFLGARGCSDEISVESADSAINHWSVAMTYHPDHSRGLQDNTEVLHRISQRLAARFVGVFTAETVDRYVFESYTALARTAKITIHLPATTEHFATERLKALAKSKGAVTHEVPEVLFVCVQNAGRSQMAAALLNLEAKGKIHVRSAGSLPAAHLDPVVLTVMSEMGLDLSKDYPKPLTDDVVRASDVVITMGCGDSCPIYPGKRYEDWQVTDPAGKSLENVREIRDQIQIRVKSLVASLVTEHYDAPKTRDT